LAKFFGIQGKTAFIFLGVFILIILPVNYIIYSNVKRILMDADSKELKAEGEKLFSQVKLDPQLLPLPSLGYSIFLHASNGLQTDSIFASPGFPTYFSTIQQEPALEIDTLKIITLTRALEYGNGLLFFSISRSNKRLTAQIQELKTYLFSANVISILIAGILVYFVSGYTLRPIKKIIIAAQTINASKSIERVPVPSTADENRILALAINEMLSRIEHSIITQTNFFASAAHELRTPLAIMKAELTIAQEDKRWHSMLKEVERLERTVNDFLMISQLKSESLIIRKQHIDLDELLFSALKKVKYLSEEKKSKVQIILNDENTDYKIAIDGDKVECVLTNLIENAIKYSSENSAIQIYLGKKDLIQIEIRNLIDQPIADPNRLKQEFVKAETLSAGLGMGLWIANEIIELHGGKLELKCEDLIFSVIVNLPA